MQIEVVKADYMNESHAKDICYLLNSYARDPMGGGQALDDKIKNSVVRELAKLPHAFSVICYVDDKPTGLINCFDAFSTFSCKPLVNIHDVVVLEEYRGLGLSQKMLAQVEVIARSKGCCKITLEVLQGNTVAKSSYNKFGFSDFELDPKMGKALFWQKLL